MASVWLLVEFDSGAAVSLLADKMKRLFYCRSVAADAGRVAFGFWGIFIDRQWFLVGRYYAFSLVN